MRTKDFAIFSFLSLKKNVVRFVLSMRAIRLYDEHNFELFRILSWANHISLLMNKKLMSFFDILVTFLWRFVNVFSKFVASVMKFLIEIMICIDDNSFDFYIKSIDKRIFHTFVKTWIKLWKFLIWFSHFTSREALIINSEKYHFEQMLYFVRFSRFSLKKHDEF